MIRITHSTEEGTRIEGRLDAHSVGLVRETVGRAAKTIDLSGLTSIDREGRAYLLELREAGFRLRGGSLYINRLLEELTRDS